MTRPKREYGIPGLEAALADLAALFPYGALTMETDPAEFIRSVVSEIERLRRQEVRLLRLGQSAAATPEADHG